MRFECRSAARAVRGAAALVAASLLMVACAEPTADADQPAYDPTYSAGGRTVLYHWRAGSTIRVYAQPSASSISADLPATLRSAFAVWRAEAEFREYVLVLVDRPADADVIVRFRSEAPLISYADCTYPSTAASGVTFFCPDAALQRVQVLPLLAGAPGHVRMEVAVSASAVAGRFESVVAHEIGHVLGIGAHSREPADLMYPFPTAQAPSARDAATLRYVLHQPSALVL